MLFRDITKNWAGFNFPATETVVISIILYSYPEIKWVKKKKRKKKYNTVKASLETSSVEIWNRMLSLGSPMECHILNAEC